LCIIKKWRKNMKRKIIPILVIGLMLAGTGLPVLADSAQNGGAVEIEKSTPTRFNENLDVAITTDWVAGWQNHGLRVREFAIDEDVYAYFEVSSDDTFGLKMTHEWWYDNGTGLEFKWSWFTTCGDHYISWATWTWWDIGLDYGPGVGYIKVLLDDVYVGQTNWFAIDNTQPSAPSIIGETEGKAKEEYEYTINGVDPDGFDVSYFVDWGDGTDSGWTNFVASGTDVKLKHTWDKKDDYTIKCKVKDLAESESDWTTLEVSMPVTYQTYTFPVLERILELFPIIKYILGI
jgi:hypothetical protein